MKSIGNKFSEHDHSELGNLVERLHNLADQLTRESPSKAKMLFATQVPQLQRDLDKVKAAVAKQRKMAEKKQSK